jgi:hypothetical protein
MNNHLISGSESFNIGFIDSGTTFTYLPSGLYNELKVHFDWFCSLDKESHCKGSRIYSPKGYICF